MSRVPSALPRSIARLTASGTGYCSGVLIAPDIVATCAHFFRPGRSQVQVRIDGLTVPSAFTQVLAGTDIALVRLARRVAAQPVPLGPAPRPLSRTVTFGFGARAAAPAARPGVFLGELPVSYSRTFATRVRPAGFVYADPPAVKGDSGGPVLVGGRVIGLQSLILNPGGRNLRLSTVALWPAEPNGPADALHQLG